MNTASFPAPNKGDLTMKQQADLKQVLADSEDHLLALIADTSLACGVLELLVETDNREIFARTSLSAWSGLARLLGRIRKHADVLMDDLHQIDQRTTRL